MKKEKTKRFKEPVRYTVALADEICERLSDGESLNAICKEDRFPSEASVRNWAIEDVDGFSSKYTRAREIQADVLVDEIIAIADEQAVCYTDGGTAFDPDVNRDRLRIDARKWFASKVLPKKYGEKIQTEHTGTVQLTANPLDEKL
jgi:hypothetical protein